MHINFNTGCNASWLDLIRRIGGSAFGMRIIEGIEHSTAKLGARMLMPVVCVRTTLPEVPVSRRRAVMPPPGCMFSPILNEETYCTSWTQHGIPEIIYEEPPTPEIFMEKITYKVVSCDSPRRSSKLRIQNIMEDNASYYSSLKPKNVHIVLSISVPPHKSTGGASFGEQEHVDSGPLRLWRLLIKAPSSTQDMRAAQCGLVFVSSSKYERPGELLAGFDNWTAATYDAYLRSMPNRGEYVPGPCDPVAFFELAPGREETSKVSSWYGPIDFPKATGHYICIKILHGQVYRPMSEVQAKRIVADPDCRPSRKMTSKASVCGTYADQVEIDAADEYMRRTAMTSDKSAKERKSDSPTTICLAPPIVSSAEAEKTIISQLESAFDAEAGPKNFSSAKSSDVASGMEKATADRNANGSSAGEMSGKPSQLSSSSSAEAAAGSLPNLDRKGTTVENMKRSTVLDSKFTRKNGKKSTQGKASKSPTFRELYGKGLAIQYVGIYGANQVSSDATTIIHALDKIESQLKEVEAWVVSDASNAVGANKKGHWCGTSDKMPSKSSGETMQDTRSTRSSTAEGFSYSEPQRSVFQSKLMMNSMLMLRTERFILRNAGRLCQCCGWSGGSHLIVKLMLLNKTGNPCKKSQARYFGAYDLFGRPLFLRKDKRQWIDDFDLRGSQRLQLIVKYLLEVVSTRLGEEHIKRGVVWQLMFERAASTSHKVSKESGGTNKAKERENQEASCERPSLKTVEEEEMSCQYEHSCSDIMAILRNEKRGRQLVSRAFYK